MKKKTSIKTKKTSKKTMIINPFVRPGEYRDDEVISCREYLLYKRIMYMDHTIHAPASDTILTLMMMDDISHDPITMFFYCPGGSMDAGFAICDTLGNLKSPIYTVAFSIQSMAVPLFMCKDKRFL
jgi:ATP-dependent protease ClpP protease subunit